MNQATEELDLISRLPDSILVVVFKDVTWTPSQYPFESDSVCECDNKALVWISHVSRRWRQIAISYSSLWAYASSRYRPGLTALFLDRSRRSHLHIDIDLRDANLRYQRVLDESIPLIMAQSYRTVELQVRFFANSHLELDVISLLENAAAPVLKKLIIERWRGATLHLPQSLFEDTVRCPPLQLLSLRNVIPDWKSVTRTETLKHLTIHSVDLEIRQFITFIGLCPNLESLRMLYMDGRLPESPSDDWRTQAQQWWPTHKHELPKLESLTYEGRRIQPLLLLFPLFAMPALVSIDIRIFSMTWEEEIPQMQIMYSDPMFSWFLPNVVTVGHSIELELPYMIYDEESLRLGISVKTRTHSFHYSYGSMGPQPRRAFNFRALNSEMLSSIMNSFLDIVKRFDGRNTTRMSMKCGATDQVICDMTAFLPTLFTIFPNIRHATFEGFRQSGGIQQLLHSLWPEPHDPLRFDHIRSIELLKIPFIPTGPMMETLRGFLKSRIASGLPSLDLALVECDNVDEDLALTLLGPFSGSLTVKCL